MTPRELTALRSVRWRLKPDLALTNLDEINDFIERMGMCVQTQRDSLALPSLSQAIMGRESVPLRGGSPVREVLNEFSSRALKKRSCIEVPFLSRFPVILSRESFTLLYAVHKQRRGSRGMSVPRTRLERELLDFITDEESATRKLIRDRFELHRPAQRAALDRALNALRLRLDILRTGAIRGEGALYQTPLAWDQGIARRAQYFSRQEALKELVRRYVTATVATSRRRVKRVFAAVAQAEEIDRALNMLILTAAIEVDQQLVIGGKKALVAPKKALHG